MSSNDLLRGAPLLSFRKSLRRLYALVPVRRDELSGASWGCPSTLVPEFAPPMLISRSGAGIPLAMASHQCEINQSP